MGALPWHSQAHVGSIPALFTPSSSNTQEPGGSNSLLSMVLVLASYQSVFYYKMLTHSFYVYFKL